MDRTMANGVIRVYSSVVIEPLLRAWADDNRCSDYGFSLSLNEARADMEANLAATSCGLFTTSGMDGFIFVLILDNYLNGNAPLALVKYWYSQGQHGKALFDAAMAFAKDEHAQHFIVSASQMMPENHDKIADFCVSSGFLPYETAFIKEIG